MLDQSVVAEYFRYRHVAALNAREAERERRELQLSSRRSAIAHRLPAHAASAVPRIYVAVLEKLVEQAAEQSSDAFRLLEKWLQLAPFDVRPHELLLNALLRAGRVREAEDHYSATTHLFEAESLDWLPIREVWRVARQQVTSEPRAIVFPDTSHAVQPPQTDTSPTRRASICVMPFIDRTSSAPQRGGFADGLTET